MTRATLVAIFKQAIMDMAFKEGIQVNTFYHLDRMPDFNNQALGATMDLYHEGRFWSRDWANSGASPDEICAQWPIAVLEDQDVEDECLWEKEYEFELELVIMDRLTCDNCPNFQEQTSTQVQKNTFDALRSLMNEIMSFEYNTMNDGSDDRNEWMSTGRRDYYIGEGQTLVTTLEDLRSILLTQTAQLIERGIGDNLRGYGVRLRFTLCEDFSATFKYSTTLPKSLTTNLCDSC